MSRGPKPHAQLETDPSMTTDTQHAATGPLALAAGSAVCPFCSRPHDWSDCPVIYTPIIDCEYKDHEDGCCSHPKNGTPECHVAACPRLNRKLRADTERLDWLDDCRKRLNAHCGSSYGWEVIRSHLVNRLMVRTPEACAMAGIDVNDTGPRGKDIRTAIDEAKRPDQPNAQDEPRGK